ncbi:hypothetical protein A9Q81_25090 [Gammaproteobacteria bacterium 42_54_T18]|nr:hypothetical protein A9Q81_25090 [Gammaproteobacteria bacterium 42_54_T18]
MQKTTLLALSKRKQVTLHTLWLRGLFGVLLSTLSFGMSVAVANDKDKLETRYSVMSMKAAGSLLVDAVNINGKLVVVGARGHILVSRDDGKSWKQAKVPTQNLITAVYFASSDLGWAVGHEAVILHTKDGGDSWDFQYGAPFLPAGYDDGTDVESEVSDEDLYAIDRSGSPLLDVWFKNEKEGFAIGAYGYFLHTSDAGQTWHDWSKRLGNIDGWHLNAIYSLDGSLVYVAGEKGVLFRSSNGGENWDVLTSPYDGSFFGMVVGPGLNEMTMFGLQGHIFRTSDRGDNWREIETENQNGLMAGTLYGDRGVILVGNGGVMMFSKDDGNSFVKQVTDDRNSIAGIVRTDKNKLILVGQGGVKLATPNKSLVGMD